MIEATIGGNILGISGLLLPGNMLGPVLHKKHLETSVEMPIAEPLDPVPAPAWLDSKRPWLATAVALIVIAYGPVLLTMITNMGLTSPGSPVARSGAFGVLLFSRR